MLFKLRFLHLCWINIVFLAGTLFAVRNNINAPVCDNLAPKSLSCVDVKCNNNNVVVSIPTAKLTNFLLNPDLETNLFVVQGNSSDVSYNKNGDVLKITFPYRKDTERNIYWSGDQLIYPIYESISYITDVRRSYQLNYACSFSREEERFRSFSDVKEKNFINYLQYRDGAEKFSGEACNSFFNITILPAFMSWDVKSALSALYPLKAIVQTFKSNGSLLSQAKSSLPGFTNIVMNDGDTAAPSDTQLFSAYIYKFDVPVQAFGAILDRAQAQQTFAMLPPCAWGSEYILISYSARKSYVVVVSYYPDTEVEVRLKNQGNLKFNFTVSASVAYFVAGQGYLANVTDLSGILLLSNQPVGVFSVMQDAKVPAEKTSTHTNNLVEQLLPVSLWGSEYIASCPSFHHTGCIIRLVSYWEHVLVKIYQANSTREFKLLPYSYYDVDLVRNDKGYLTSVNGVAFMAVLLGKGGLIEHSSPSSHFRSSFHETEASNQTLPFLVQLTPVRLYSSMHTVPPHIYDDPTQTITLTFTTNATEDMRFLGFPTSSEDWLLVSNRTDQKVAQFTIMFRDHMQHYYASSGQSRFSTIVYKRSRNTLTAHMGAMNFVHIPLNVPSAKQTTPLVDTSVPPTTPFPIDACASFPCQNNGICSPTNTSRVFECVCDNRHAGRFCQEVVSRRNGLFYMAEISTPEIRRGFGTTESTRLWFPVKVEIVSLGQHYYIRSLDGCPNKYPCLSWLSIYEERKVGFLQGAGESPYPWTMVAKSFDDPGSFLISGITGEYLSIGAYYHLSNDSDKAISVQLLPTTLNSSVLESQKYDSFTQYEVQNIFSVMSSIQVPLHEPGVLLSPGFRLCFWYKAFLTSQISFPEIIFRLRANTIKVKEFPGLNPGMKAIAVIDKAGLETPTTDEYNAFLRDFWHFACFQSDEVSLTVYVDSFKIAKISLSDLESNESSTIDIAYCSPQALPSCFLGFVQGISVWSLPTSSESLHSIYTKPSACGPAAKGIKLIGPNIITRDILFPICACRHCPVGWSNAGSQCFSVVQQRFTFREYQAANLSNNIRPAVLTSKEHRFVASSMVDSISPLTLPYVSRFLPAFNDTYLWLGTFPVVKEQTAKNLSLAVCAVYSPRSFSSIPMKNLSYWPSRAAGAIARPNDYYLEDGDCFSPRSGVYAQNSRLFQSTESTIIFLLDNLQLYKSMVTYKTVLKSICELFQDVVLHKAKCCLVARGLNCATSLAEFEQNILKNVDIQSLSLTTQATSLGKILPRDSYVVLATTAVQDDNSIIRNLKTALIRSHSSIYALGFGKSNLRFVQSLATHPHFAHYNPFNNLTRNNTSWEKFVLSFQRFICGIKQSNQSFPLSGTSDDFEDPVFPNTRNYPEPKVMCGRHQLTVELDQRFVLEKVNLVSSNNIVVYFEGYKSNKGCRATNAYGAPRPVYRLSAHYPFQECGLNVQHSTNRMYVSGKIFRDYLNINLPISFGIHLANINCSYANNNSSIKESFKPVLNRDASNITGRGKFFNIDISLYRDETLRNMWPHEPDVIIGNRMNVLVNASHPVPQGLRMIVVFCVASPKSVYMPNSTLQIPLIKDGCVPTIASAGLGARIIMSDDRSLHFNFLVFKWRNLLYKKIFVHCLAEVCDSRLPSCAPCSSARRRRSLANGVYQLTTSVALQPITAKSATDTTNQSKNNFLPTESKLTTLTETNLGIVKQPLKNHGRGPATTGFQLSDYKMACLLLFTFLFFLTIIVVVLHVTRRDSFSQCVKHTASRYYRGLSVSDITQHTYPKPAVNQATATSSSVFSAGAHPVIDSTHILDLADIQPAPNTRQVLLKEVVNAANNFRSVAGVSVQPRSNRKRKPFSTFLGSDSETPGGSRLRSGISNVNTTAFNDNDNNNLANNNKKALNNDGNKSLKLRFEERAMEQTVL
ncbi:unnamed protein product [Clavelina lepadiformis]|uniref:EGF-like domain-containing protein n=1 Tax=Clavelina lepadiformis TaxID=159417 RepID=A0ABP0GF36_CLALP